jgi:sugar phosphate isomerase/epimerase
MRLGVYSLITPDYEIEEAAALVAGIGYEGIEWTVDYEKAVWDGASRWHISTDDLEATASRAREAAEQNGLAIPGLGTRCNCFEPERVSRYMEVARMVGAPAVRVMAPRYDGSTHYDELLSRARAAYEEVETLARGAQVRAVVELHHGLISASASGTRRLLEGRDPQWVGAMLDPGNMLREGMENWRMACEILGPYLHHVHVKDAFWLRGDDGAWRCEGAALAEGLIDWQQVMDALRNVGYEGFLDLEDLRGGWARKPEGITTRRKLEEAYEHLAPLL